MRRNAEEILFCRADDDWLAHGTSRHSFRNYIIFSVTLADSNAIHVIYALAESECRVFSKLIG